MAYVPDYTTYTHELFTTKYSLLKFMHVSLSHKYSVSCADKFKK